MRAAESSLRQLGTDYIDLYQIHWPNPKVPIKETMGAMEALVYSGQVRYIGVSNFSVKELEEARAAMTKYPIVSNQVLYNLKRREIEKDLLPYCQQNHVTVIAYTPLADGSLTTRSPSQEDQRRVSLLRAAGRLLGRERERQRLQEVADEVGKTPAQVALNWCISHPSVIVIPKSNSLARIEENCGASGWRLSEDQLRQLDEAFPV
jgi:myo-inositol catabolism protein IolS